MSGRKCVRSPLKTHAFSPERLPRPRRKFDLALTLLPVGKKPGFESKTSARMEDILRAKKLKNSALSDAKTLGEWLEAATAERSLPLSPPSAVYMREARRLWLGEIQRLFHNHGYRKKHVSVFTFIHPKWFWKHGSLHKCSPKKVKKRLLRYLERAGVTSVDGMLFAGLHGEFDGTGYQLHFHGAVVGPKATELEKLRGKFGFKITNTIYRPIQITPLENAPRQLSYLVQSFWPYKERYLDRDGNERRKRKKSRIPSPQHEEILLWLAKQNLCDLILMNGMRLGKAGLTSNAIVHEFP